MASTTQTQSETTKPRSRKPKAPTGAPQRPTVTRREYFGEKGLLATRLAAMKAYADGEIDLATRNVARQAVRKAGS